VDKRSLLLGFGLGIISGALLMQLFIMGEKSSSQLKEIDHTINNVEAPAEQPQVEQTPVIEEENTLEEDKTEEANEEQLGAIPTPGSEADQSNKSDDDREYSVDEQFPKTLLLRIYSGTTVTELASVLAEKGIIEDKNSFIDYTRGKSKHNKIRAGYFYVNEASTNEDILNIVTSQPISEEKALQLIDSKQYDVIFSQ